MKLDEVKHTFVGGIKTACVTRKELVAIFVEKISESSQNSNDSDVTTPMVVFDSNGHGLSMAYTDDSFFDSLRSADIIHADGQSIVAFSKRFSSNAIPERSATTDTIHDIPQYYEKNLSHFLLGGEKQIVEKCANILKSKYDNFEIAGIHDGFFSEDQEEDVIDYINAAKPDVLWVGLGKPKEQLFVIKNKHKFNVPVIITCGGCYNYITGDYARAPEWLQNLGLEWLHRALTEPKKFLWRYITTNPHAIYCAIKYRNVKY